MPNIGEGFAWYVIFVFSATVHEASHGWAALRGGDPTAYHGGQVSLDPMPHIRRSPFGMVVLPIISVLMFGWPFGFASAPYDPYWAQRHPKRSALMALAGPAANFLLMVAVALCIRVGIFLGGFENPESAIYTHIVEARGEGLWPILGMILSMTFSLNLILLVLNLIPVPPLDGWSAIRLFFSDETARKLQQLTITSGFSWIGIVIAWQIFPHILSPMFTLSLNLLYPGSGYH